MFKYKLAIFVLLTMFFTSVQAYCQQQNKDLQVKTIAGTVTYVDVAGSIISVQTDKGTMVFNFSVESNLFRYAHHMASIEIEKGDPVIIQYKSVPFGKNDIVKLVDERAENF